MHAVSRKQPLTAPAACQAGDKLGASELQGFPVWQPRSCTIKSESVCLGSVPVSHPYPVSPRCTGRRCPPVFLWPQAQPESDGDVDTDSLPMPDAPESDEHESLPERRPADDSESSYSYYSQSSADESPPYATMGPPVFLWAPAQEESVPDLNTNPLQELDTPAEREDKGQEKSKSFSLKISRVGRVSCREDAVAKADLSILEAGEEGDSEPQLVSIASLATAHSELALNWDQTSREMVAQDTPDTFIVDAGTPEVNPATRSKHAVNATAWRAAKVATVKGNNMFDDSASGSMEVQGTTVGNSLVPPEEAALPSTLENMPVYEASSDANSDSNASDSEYWACRQRFEHSEDKGGDTDASEFDFANQQRCQSSSSANVLGPKRMWSLPAVVSIPSRSKDHAADARLGSLLARALPINAQPSHGRKGRLASRQRDICSTA